MRKLLSILIISLCLVSCGSSKKTTSSSSKSKKTTTKTYTKADYIVKTALTFNGTRYKYGGTTKSGMDCSGLTYTAFNKHNVALPRVSYEQAKRGKKISLSTVRKGDLVFFKTNKNKNRINHVGLVLSNTKGEIKFIHSTSSRGVLISSLREGYWKSAYAEARRVL